MNWLAPLLCGPTLRAREPGVRADGVRMPDTSRPVVVDGVRYPSVSAAARALGCSMTRVYYLIGEKGHT